MKHFFFFTPVNMENSFSFIFFCSSLLLSFGVVFAYFLQIRKIIKQKTSKGISQLYIVFSSISTNTNMFNLLLKERKLISDMKKMSFFDYLFSYKNLFLSFIQNTMFFIYFGFFMCFFEDKKSHDPTKTRNTSKWNSFLCVLFSFVLEIILTIYSFSYEDKEGKIPSLFGICSSLFTVLQFFPMFAVLIKHKKHEIWSIVSLSIFLCGSIFTALFVFLDKKTCSLFFWLPYVCQSVMYFFMILLVLHYRKEDKKKKIKS